MPITPNALLAAKAAADKRRQERNSLWITDSSGFVHIPLTMGKEAVIDEKDKPIASQYSWYAKKGSDSGLFYAVAHVAGTLHSVIFLHNLIFPVGEGKTVDHIDRNGLNCVRSNLREATASQNACNRKHPTSAPFHGITKRGDKWAAQIHVDGKRKCVGLFQHPEDAARAYDHHASQAFGQFALLNFSAGCK